MNSDPNTKFQFSSIYSIVLFITFHTLVVHISKTTSLSHNLSPKGIQYKNSEFHLHPFTLNQTVANLVPISKIGVLCTHF